MASIGTLSLFSIRHGVPAPPAEGVEVFRKPGADGVALRLEGKRGDTFSLLGIQHHATAAAYKTHITDAKALTEDDPMTVTDDAEQTWDEIAVVAVRVRRVQPIIATGYTFRTEIEFECVDTSTS